jgi:hypothetical protein
MSRCMCGWASRGFARLATTETERVPLGPLVAGWAVADGNGSSKANGPPRGATRRGKRAFAPFAWDVPDLKVVLRP